MLISHRHRFVFLAFPKTASTATTLALAPYAEVRSRHVTKCTPDFPFYHHIPARALKRIFDQRGWDWFSYHRFCITRNPFDRVVSHYYWRKTFHRHGDRSWWFNAIRYARHKAGEPRDFKTFVTRLDTKAQPMLLLNNFISDEDGRQLVDDILRFERLPGELTRYMRFLGIELPEAHLKRANITSSRGPVHKYYDDQSAARVARLYSYEIQRFGYGL